MELASMTNTSEIINYALKGVIGNAEKAKDFAIEQAPDIIHQLIVWNIGSHIMSSSIALILYIVLLVLCKKWWALFKEESEDGYFYGAICGWVFGSLIAIPVILIDVYNLVQLLVAPKIWLIEYAANLISNK